MMRRRKESGRGTRALLSHIARTPAFFQIGPVHASSGAVVPIVPDIRTLYSDPKILALLGRLIAREAKELHIDVLAGIETAGIPLAAAASLVSGIPMLYLRKRPHRGWKRSIIEGVYRRGARAALIDDAMTFGGQKAAFIRKLNGELSVRAVLTVWDSSYPSRYRRALRRKDIAVRSLVTKREVIDLMLTKGLMHRDTYDLMIAQTRDPRHWQKDAALWKKLFAVKRRGTL